MSLSRHSWFGYAIVVGVLCLAAGLWGYTSEDAVDASPLDAVIYIALPVAIFASVALSRGHRRLLLLLVAGLLDLEAALLGFAPMIALPFVVAVPLASVAVSARLVQPARLQLPYAAAWLASSAGVTIAVLRVVESPIQSTLVVIPAFVVADAVMVTMLYGLDRARLRAVQAINQAESQARDLINGVELFGVNVGRDSRIDFINDYALRLTGWTRDEVIGKDWWDTFATPERREQARENYRHVVSDEREMDHRRQSPILTRSGEVRIMRWSHVHRRGPDGAFIGLASLAEDITAMEAAAEERRRNQELVSNLVVGSPLAAAVLTLDRTVQLWNPAAAELLGWTEEEVLGKPIPPVFLAQDRWTIGRLFVWAARGEPPEHRLVQLVRKDGQTVLARFYVGTVRDRDDRPMAVSVQARDVTAIHAMEEKLREAQQMEAIGRLAGGVAHDFNNSLTAIGGFASLIASSTSEQETRVGAETILQASRRAADLTRELLAYSRRSLLKPQTIDVNELLVSVKPVVVSLLGPAVSLVIEADTPQALVRVDPGGLERAIVNLATNARDAMPDGGIVTISTRADLADASEPGHRWICISVVDAGSGIPAEAQSKVFDPFYTTKPVGSGTGLGLAMVKGFVIQSGGQVSLSSELGRGTTIEIRLPEAVATPAVAAQPQVLRPPGGNETILLVEDDPAVAALGFRILSLNGYRVLLADSAGAALSLLRGHFERIDLFLVDVMLPDKRGPVLVESARPIHPEAAVLYASGYSGEAMSRAGELPPGIDLIEKPYEPEELLTRVRSILDRAQEDRLAG
jgi:two-component system cell cycle sensor histidine kinase/response regulator CckA